MSDICAWCGEREPVEGDHWCQECLDQWDKLWGRDTDEDLERDDG